MRLQEQRRSSNRRNKQMEDRASASRARTSNHSSRNVSRRDARSLPPCRRRGGHPLHSTRRQSRNGIAMTFPQADAKECRAQARLLQTPPPPRPFDDHKAGTRSKAVQWFGVATKGWVLHCCSLEACQEWSIAPFWAADRG